ncbi:alpha/beta hydrolase [Rhizobium sp. BK376]|uniref:alpha/beta fold hydrolase n=1 Tax=Rhizobium sp. BK376 TaxID=2512149 RepID=UPI0010518CB0|nr:alpha/beta hydrolase [Rhizobium sp. BK376]TCR93094.1 pimeloyl-ACP methyl ester carboxylesterase [Rhizobium sp. BK376]
MTSDYETGFLARIFTASDGLKLYARDYGHDNPLTADRAPVLCLPGLTRNSRDFHQLALILSRDTIAPRRVITVDARGRGLSTWDDDKSHYNLNVEADDVLSACAVFDIAQAAFIGTSRGGLVLHIIAGTRPDILKAVVLNDIGPVLETEGLHDIRTYLNRERKPADWDDAAEILKENHGASFPALIADDWQDMAYAIYAEIEGKVTADFDPAIATQMLALDLDAPLPDLWQQFDGFNSIPMMVIRGENSKLLSAATVTEMEKRHPGMIAVEAMGQGHAPLLHLDNIPHAIQSFLAANS